MGTAYRETFTKPLPAGAELFTRDGERFARWIDGKGRKRTARIVRPETGAHANTDRLLIEARTFTARYRDGSGIVRKVATGCRTADGANIVLAELERRAERVRSGTASAAEDAALDHLGAPIGGHVEAYLAHLAAKRGKGGKPRVSPKHVANVRHCLGRIVGGCEFRRLRDLERGAVERWAAARDAEGMPARTLNAHLVALTAFGNWCVDTKRLATNPLARPPKRDESADRRRQRRALTEDELRRLLYAARWRSLAEYGRASVKLAGVAERTDKRSRRTWVKAPLTADTLPGALARARETLAGRPAMVAELERRGRERALIFKALVLTGLRKGELASLTIGQLELDGPVAYAVLRAADEKAGRGADIPIRADLAADLRAWIGQRLADAQAAAGAKGLPLPARLPADAPLFNLRGDLIRAFDRDLLAAGLAKVGVDTDGREFIDKRDDRGRTLDVHSLRHTFGTHLSKGGVSPRVAQAAMRHSTLELTMNTYTDPRLLDVAGALDALPSLPLDGSPDAERMRATGSDGPTSLVPTLVQAAGYPCASAAFAGQAGAGSGERGNTLSSVGDATSATLTLQGQKRATRLERATFSLEG